MDATFTDASDICQQLLDRYGNSAAPQHRHLCAIAAATRSIIQSESLPLTPLSYFASTIYTLSDQTQLDQEALAALSTFLSIVLPLVPEKGIAPDKAKEALEVVVQRVNSNANAISLGTATARALVKCLGFLIGFFNLDDWNSVEFGFNTLLSFSNDKRPKVRKCAQDCFLTTFKSFKSSAVIKKASKLVYSMLENHMAMAVKISNLNVEDGFKDDIISKPECQEVFHMLNLLKIVVPYLSVKVCAKVLSQISKLLSCKFSALSRHVFDVIEVIFETSGAEVIVPDVEKIIKSLVSYINLRKNPMDTVLFGANLAKCAIEKLHANEIPGWMDHFRSVIGSIACLLNSDGSTALEASKILKELIKHHIDGKFLLSIEKQEEDDKVSCTDEQRATKSICDDLKNLFSSKDSIPNEHILAVIAVLFLRLGEVSAFYMKSIVVKLAEAMTVSRVDGSDTTKLQSCVGSAVVAMGPEKLLALLPLSINPKDLSCSNAWLIPILKEYIVGSSLGFFMEHIMPLAKFLQKDHEAVKNPDIVQDLCDKLWELLPAFCCYPTDGYKNFGALAKVLISCIKESFMLQTVANALQELVNQNKSILASDGDPQGFTKFLKLEEADYFMPMLRSKHSYAKKTANKNIKALGSCSEELLQALVDVMFKLAPDNKNYLKDAIRCLASITDPSITKIIFTYSLKRLQLINDFGDLGLLESDNKGTEDNNDMKVTSEEKDSKRCLILDLALCFIDGANEDLINLLFKVTRHSLEEAVGTVQSAAYHTLSRILEIHPSFFSSISPDLMDLLSRLKPPSDITCLRSRLSCFKTLLVYAVKENLGEEDTKAFLILNEIILKLKDSEEEGRKAAYDVLVEISSSLCSSSVASSGPYNKLITMVLGYLTGPSPQIRSGAVSALSVLVYNDADICLSVPDLVSSVLPLLQTKAVEVTKATLGFVKVLVSTLKAQDLEKFLFDIVHGILPWSSQSRHHLRSKVTVILEIMMRKCGIGAIQSVTPPVYGDFVKSVSENRHGKTNSKEAESGDTKSEPPMASQIGQQKRKREESRNLPKEGISGFKRMKGGKNQKSTTPNARGHYMSPRVNGSNHDKQRGGRLRTRDNNRSNFKKGQSGTTRRKMEHTEATTKKNKSDIHKPSGKFSKFRMSGKKQCKIRK